ncbi:MAG: 4Fe-4S binding protein [Oscillospiraceae bacterium]|nr:4Fe-4S binding protein [Oscillospiraceae bacterium]
MPNAEQIIQSLEAAGFRAAFLPIGAIEQVKEHYDALVENTPENGIAERVVERFRGFQPPKLDFVPQSILVAACPARGATLALRRRGERIEIAVAPAYIDIKPWKRRLEEVLAGTGCRYEETPGISQKLLAAMGGLGQYGRNNICYVGDWGSYSWLETRYTDIPYLGRARGQLRMEACEGCELCRDACPTGAIGEWRQIDVSRCLTYRNESNKHMPFWMPKNAHHTLSGCLRCQECCPQNPPVDYSHALELDERDTRRLLSRSKRLPKDLEEKFLAFGCEKWTMSVLKRNARLAAKTKQNI